MPSSHFSVNICNFQKQHIGTIKSIHYITWANDLLLEMLCRKHRACLGSANGSAKQTAQSGEPNMYIRNRKDLLIPACNFVLSSRGLKSHRAFTRGPHSTACPSSKRGGDWRSLRKLCQGSIEQGLGDRSDFPSNSLSNNKSLVD